MCLAETKLCEAIKIDLDNNFVVWRKDNGQRRRGVMMTMTKKKLLDKQVLHREGRVMSIKVENGNKEVLITVAYVPLKTSSWSSQGQRS